MTMTRDSLAQLLLRERPQPAERNAVLTAVDVDWSTALGFV